MNLYKGLLFDLSYNHSNKFDDDAVNTYLLNRTSTRPRSHIFHVGKPPGLFSRNNLLKDCPYTNKRVCYCNLHDSRMIPKKEKDLFESINEVLDLQSKGYDEKFQENLFYRNTYIKEWIKEMDSLEYIRFCKNQYSESAENEEKQQQQKAPNPSQNIERQHSFNPNAYQNGPEINPAMPYKKVHTDYLRPTGSHVNLVPHSTHSGISNDSFGQADQKNRDELSPAPPKRRRGRQLGYRKKKDNPDEEEEFACHYSKCGKSTNPEDFLQCQNCQRYFHAQCNEPPLNKTIVSRFDWFCNECKICFSCKSNEEEQTMLICDICDRAFHMDCLTPPMANIPKGEWYCRDCTECKSCGKNLRELKNFPNIASNFVNAAFRCENCAAKLSKGGNDCPLCKKLVTDEDEGDFVYCDQCNLWVHAECENIPAAKLREMEKKKAKFICSACMRKSPS